MVIPILVFPIVLTFICNDIALGFGLGILIAGVICLIGSCDGHWFELPPYPDELNVDAMPMLQQYQEEYKKLFDNDIDKGLNFYCEKIQPFYPLHQHWHFGFHRWVFNEPNVTYCINKKMMYMLHPVGQAWDPEFGQWLTPSQSIKFKLKKKLHAKLDKWTSNPSESDDSVLMGFGMGIGNDLFNGNSN